VASQLVKLAINATETAARTRPKTSADRGETVCAGSGRLAVRRITWSMSRSM
jgi:hypothetical protein